MEAIGAVGVAATALSRGVNGVAANREHAPLELRELQGRIVRACRISQRFWERGMHASDLGLLEDTVDRAQALYDDALSGLEASNMGIDFWCAEVPTAVKVGKWTLGMYTPLMEKMVQDIDGQIGLAQQIASQEDLKETMEPDESAERWCAWMSVDPRTGDVVPYPRSKARQIEAAWQQQQESVYLGPEFHDATVLFKSEDWPYPYQKTPGGARSVQRVCLNSARGGNLNPSIAGEPGNFHFAFPGEACADVPLEIRPSAVVRTPIVGEVRLKTVKKNDVSILDQILKKHDVSIWSMFTK